MTGVRQSTLTFFGLAIILAVCMMASPECSPQPAAGAVDSRAARPHKSSLIKDVPHIRQKPDFCGEACVAMYLNYLGEEVDQDYVFDAAGVDPSVGRGLIARELNQALREIGFQTGEVWTRVRSQRDVHSQLGRILEDLTADIPSIVCMNTTRGPENTEHFRLILGYDARTDNLIYHEPAMDDGAYQRMSVKKFIELWPLKAEGVPDTIVRMRLKPGSLVFGEKSKKRTAADYAQHIIQLRAGIPDSFQVIVEPPFVVIGNGTQQQVAAHARRTVHWTVTLLMRDFFLKDPDEILDIWVFEDEASYRYYAKQIFNDFPDTLYGYYSPSSGALVMNIGLGGGTLVHEIVHPFIETNFPDCPPWFNEGLGSLYEWPEDIDGRIYGVVNWRLSGLVQDIRAGRLGSFRRLMNLNQRQFYSEDTGANYAQSRYLLQYLQYKRKLRPYYHAFVKNHRTDPSGIHTLKQILGIEDLQRFQHEWEQWVRTLNPGTVPVEGITESVIQTN